MVTRVFSVASLCCVKICSLNALVRGPALAKLDSFSLVANCLTARESGSCPVF